ncbi:hypothetical protein [Nocardioides sp. Leaf374]|uniref:hypothetical protein n=1 Tax=Nocardioides sp. Leaf374 TaxID=2876560 RepID=UPI001E41A801|nr:hypothetical protein [Nocardioides sp. Leaf374]
MSRMTDAEHAAEELHEDPPARGPWSCLADLDGYPCPHPVSEGRYCETHSGDRRLLAQMHRLLGYRNDGTER